MVKKLKASGHFNLEKLEFSYKALKHSVCNSSYKQRLCEKEGNKQTKALTKALFLAVEDMCDAHFLLVQGQW